MNLKEKLDIEREEEHRALINRFKEVRDKYLADEKLKTPEQVDAEQEAKRQAEIAEKQFRIEWRQKHKSIITNILEREKSGNPLTDEEYKSLSPMTKLTLVRERRRQEIEGESWQYRVEDNCPCCSCNS